MSNQKGNGIQQSRKNEAQLIKDNHALGIKVTDLLEKDERSATEINRLKSLTSDYGTICTDCNRATDNQLKLTKANRRLKTLNNWACIALGIAAVTITLLMRGK